MGLDMYLSGRKYLHTRWDLEGEAREAATRKEDGHRVEELKLSLGYWRKHSHLHGYIVREFAGGADNCQEIDLSAEDLQKIIEAVEKGDLPRTEGFFFGDSDRNGWMDPEGVEESTKMLHGALRWLSDKQPHESRSVVYQASW